MNQLKKRTLAGLMAAGMAAAVLPPALPAYAVNNYGDHVTITFHTGDGPPVGLHNSTWQALAAGTGADPSAAAVLSGQSGYLLTDASNAVSSGLLPRETPFELLPRPQLPDWSGAALDASWAGYEFDGWYTPGGSRLERLHPAFPYENVTYDARWKGNPANPYRFSVRHLAEVPAGGAAADVAFYETDPTWTAAGTAVSTSYKRTIPGYEFTGTALGTDYDYAPRQMRKYGEGPGSGTGENVGGFNSSYVFTGTMPNDDLEVTYRYTINPDKKFNFRVEHVNAAGTAIASTQAAQKAVGEAITAEPLSGAALAGYMVGSSRITAGDTDDLRGNGVYGVTFAGGAFAGTAFSGVMPNQAVTITYEYIADPAAQASVTVSYTDDQGRDLVAEGLVSERTAYTAAPGSAVSIPVPDLQAAGYMQGVNLSYDNLASAALSGGQVTAVTQTGSGTVTIMYVVNQSDTANWARLTFLSGPNGSLQGNSSPRVVGKGRYVINSDGTTSPEVTDSFTIVPDAPYYMGDGWYLADPSGTPAGSRLEALELTGDTKLIYCFKEDPGQWVDIRFAAGANGSVSSSAAQHLRRGTAWDSPGVRIPAATANSGYLFLGWYDGGGRLVWDGRPPVPATAFVTTTYTAKFGAVTPETGHDALNHPDASGTLDGGGSGVITVSRPAENRRYAVTDMNGTVWAERTAAQIDGGAAFENLIPGSGYLVYELSTAAPALNPGSSVIAEVTGELKSYPARVLIPAVGENAAAEEDRDHEGKVRLVIRPAAAAAEYALLDEAGGLVYDWTGPSGNPPAAVFHNLEPNTRYLVVARASSGPESAASKQDYGTDVFTGTGMPAAAGHIIQVLGGTVEAVDGAAAGTREARAAAGQAVKITAPAAADGREFKEWKVLLGRIGGFAHPSQRTRTITMPAMNVVIAAVYEEDLTATPPNASLEYQVNSGHEGEVALDLSQDKADIMRAAVTTAEDAALLGQGRKVAYRVRFTKRRAPASDSNAVKAERGRYDDAYQPAFALEVRLLRFVDGQSRPVAAGTHPGPVDILVQIDGQDRGHLDYQLWQIKADGTVSEIAPLSADPNTQPEYGGYFLFTGAVDSRYVLSYSKTKEVLATDSPGVRAGNHQAFRVRFGEGLADSADYQSWSPADPYTDAAGTVWSYVGLSTKSSGYAAFDDTEAITKDQKVYTYYESDHPAWNAARKQLEEEIDRAGRLMNNGSVSRENKDRLQDAVAEAEAVLSRHPKAAVSGLEEAYHKLKQVVDSVTGFIPPGAEEERARKQLADEIGTAERLNGDSKISGANKDKLQAAIDKANGVLNQVPAAVRELEEAYHELNRVIREVRNSIGGGGGSGGSGGSGGRGSGGAAGQTTDRYPSYTVGSDGTWQLLDAGSSSWAFVLNSGNRVSGTWAYLKDVRDAAAAGYYYHFGPDGVMDYGWYLDPDGRWYYLNKAQDGWFGRMETGWHYDGEDRRTYYLDAAGGYMVTGWKQVEGSWYYFNPQQLSYTWEYNDSRSQWEFLGGADRPYGSMYAGEQTPDRYYVDASGAFTE